MWVYGYWWIGGSANEDCGLVNIAGTFVEAADQQCSRIWSLLLFFSSLFFWFHLESIPARLIVLSNKIRYQIKYADYNLSIEITNEILMGIGIDSRGIIWIDSSQKWEQNPVLFLNLLSFLVTFNRSISAASSFHLISFHFGSVDVCFLFIYSFIYCVVLHSPFVVVVVVTIVVAVVVIFVVRRIVIQLFCRCFYYYSGGFHVRFAFCFFSAISNRLYWLIHLFFLSFSSFFFHYFPFNVRRSYIFL